MSKRMYREQIRKITDRWMAWSSESSSAVAATSPSTPHDDAASSLYVLKLNEHTEIMNKDINNDLKSNAKARMKKSQLSGNGKIP